MGAEQKKVVVMSWLLATLLMLGMSAWDSLIVGWAIFRHPPVASTVLVSSEADRLEFRRQEQRYFLDVGIYIPLEDIMFVDQLTEAGRRYETALAKGCSGLKPGRGLAIWLPFKIRIPLIGERVKEWCWKPKMRV